MLRVNEYVAVAARFFAIKDKRGVTAIEYGLIASLMAVVLVAVMKTLGGGISTAFSSIATAMSS